MCRRAFGRLEEIWGRRSRGHGRRKIASPEGFWDGRGRGFLKEKPSRKAIEKGAASLCGGDHLIGRNTKKGKLGGISWQRNI